MVKLERVKTRAEIRQSLLNFNLGAATNKHLVSKLASRTEYWVYDQQSGQFGPNKFVAYRNMTFAAYQDAINGNYDGAHHNGTVARRAIEGVLKPYTKNTALVSQLNKWLSSCLGPQSTAGVNRAKWRFVLL